jgi:hypothetical protein
MGEHLVLHLWIHFGGLLPYAAKTVRCFWSTVKVAECFLPSSVMCIG